MPRTAKSLINTEELGRAIRRRREELALSLRDVADQTSVSASTLSRIENGTGKPDADNIARLTKWLDMPIERILNQAATTRTTPRRLFIFHTNLRRKLSKPTCAPTAICLAETADALSQLFRVAYSQFSRNEPGARRANAVETESDAAMSTNFRLS